MDNLQLRKALADGSEFAYQARKVAFREYVEQTSGWNEDEQRQLHQKRFASQNFQVIQVSGLDIGILYVTRQPDYIKVS